jgi:hypothetical protein
MVSCIILCIRLVFHELCMYIKICKFVYSTVFITHFQMVVRGQSDCFFPTEIEGEGSEY